MMVLCYEAPLQVDLINLQDDASNLVLGNLPDGNNQLTPPWYIALELQDLHLHNCLYDSGAEAKAVRYPVRYQDSFVDLEPANAEPMTGPDAYQNPVPAMMLMINWSSGWSRIPSIWRDRIRKFSWSSHINRSNSKAYSILAFTIIKAGDYPV